jgi:hypothetical protein
MYRTLACSKRRLVKQVYNDRREDTLPELAPLRARARGPAGCVHEDRAARQERCTVRLVDVSAYVQAWEERRSIQARTKRLAADAEAACRHVE